MLFATSFAQLKVPPGFEPESANPILPGYYADPSVLEFEGKWYLYATLDPWGGETLGCWESPDFKNWTYRTLNWPTKAACTSRTSKGANVWAPSVVRGQDGKYYMYVSVGNEVWAGTADHPLGPWRNLLGDQPLIPENYKPGYHMIDAEAFIDEDGSAWLYWGSGLNWVNGKCWAVKLKRDMVTFDGEVRDVTPKNYFEGPFMVKHAGRYYLMYSSGNTTKDTYQVHYAVGKHPLGPFDEPANSPILVTDKNNNIVSPAHHAVFEKDGQHYVLYHRQSIPFDPGFIGRQMCVDLLNFSPLGLVEKVVATHMGPALIRGRKSTGLAAVASASSQKGPLFGPERVLDGNYATRWVAADGKDAWLQLDMGGVKALSRLELRMEYAWKPYRFIVEKSDDGKKWALLEDFTAIPAAGSPVVIHTSAHARYLRLSFPGEVEATKASLFEWLVF